MLRLLNTVDPRTRFFSSEQHLLISEAWHVLLGAGLGHYDDALPNQGPWRSSNLSLVLIYKYSFSISSYPKSSVKLLLSGYLPVMFDLSLFRLIFWHVKNKYFAFPNLPSDIEQIFITALCSTKGADRFCRILPKIQEIVASIFQLEYLHQFLPVNLDFMWRLFLTMDAMYGAHHPS